MKMASGLAESTTMHRSTMHRTTRAILRISYPSTFLTSGQSSFLLFQATSAEGLKLERGCVASGAQASFVHGK